jgi:hypothetical protein
MTGGGGREWMFGIEIVTKRARAWLRWLST